MSARKLTDAQVDEAVALARQGAGAPEVAALLRVTEATGQTSGEIRERLGKAAAASTPPEFRDVLLATARSAR